MLYNDTWQHFLRWLLENFKTSDERHRKEVLDFIEAITTKYQETVFTEKHVI